MLHSLIFGASPLSIIRSNSAAWVDEGQPSKSQSWAVVLISSIILMPLSRLKSVLEILACNGERYAISRR